jgi:hypothetical protein
MSERISGDFVKSLKEKLDREKSQIQKKRILLQDSLNIILDSFRSNSDLEIRTIRDFETSEISCFVDLYSPSEIFESVGSSLEKSNIPHTKSMLGDYKCVFIVDLESRLIASGTPHNVFSIEVFSKRLKTYKIRISHCDPKFCYSVFDKNYHEVKFWYHENLNIFTKSITLRGLDRDKKKVKISDDPSYSITIAFNETGEMSNFNLFPKKREKKQETDL